ncbi:sensor histidine kinase [Spirillospora sp. NPDC050679]
MGGWILAGRMLAPLTRIADATRLAANASHELRTPLAISKRLLDVARNGTARDQSELIERPHTVNTRAIDLTKALLLLSRGDRRSLTREPVDLSLIAEEAAETLLPLAAQRQITLDVTGEATPTVGSAALILRVVANLVQNAIVHNLPAGGTVTVHTDEHAGVGLGPAIVHSVVRAHDGILDLTPRATGGLLVTIRLPRTPHGPSPNGAR